MAGNPKRSKWFSIPQKKRVRKMISVTLSDDARKRLDKLAKNRGTHKSAVVEALILAAPLLLVLVGCTSDSTPIRAETLTPVDDASTTSSSSSGSISSSSGSTPGGPTTETTAESCSKSFSSGASTFTYAEHAYPGVSATDLAASVVVLGQTTSTTTAPPGFDRVTPGVFFRDGAVAIICGISSAPTYSSATFVRTTP